MHHVIWTGHQISKFLLNIESLFSFLFSMIVKDEKLYFSMGKVTNIQSFDNLKVVKMQNSVAVEKQ